LSDDPKIARGVLTDDGDGLKEKSRNRGSLPPSPNSEWALNALRTGLTGCVAPD